MIPKIIHYCWFGGAPLPSLTKRCIESWKKYCPDYEIMEWNETNFDLNFNQYVKEAYEAKKWAFVSDVARLYALVKFGGIYLDTDVEIIKPIDRYLSCSGFMGFETSGKIQTATIGCEKDNQVFQELLDDYKANSFLNKDGSLNLLTNVDRITTRFLSYGLIQNNTFQTIKDICIFPTDFFCPKDCSTREIHLTDNTVCIHHFDGSWLSESERRKMKIKSILGPKLSRIIAKLLSLFRKS